MAGQGYCRKPGTLSRGNSFTWSEGLTGRLGLRDGVRRFHFTEISGALPSCSGPSAFLS